MGHPRTPGVIVVDVDRFNAIDDCLGHVAGDTPLCGVAERLRAAVRHRDRGLGGAVTRRF